MTSPATAEIARFLNRVGPRRQFFPVCDLDMLAPLEFVIEGDFGGVAGLWDQTGYKQTIIPGRGELRMAYASFVCVNGDDTGVFDRLIDRLLARAAQRGLEFVVLGLSARDPLLPAALRRAYTTYESTLYSVCFSGEEDFHERLDHRIPYVELATL